MKRARVLGTSHVVIELPFPFERREVHVTMPNCSEAYDLAKHWNQYLDMLQAAADHVRT